MAALDQQTNDTTRRFLAGLANYITQFLSTHDELDIEDHRKILQEAIKMIQEVDKMLDIGGINGQV